ncbi:MAG TPA: hypothetical protein PKN48_06710 [Bacteroidales bacterium]|nr:hypothetical protein [Bacteroidales bacterium]
MKDFYFKKKRNMKRNGYQKQTYRGCRCPGYALFSAAGFFISLLYAGQSSLVAHDEITIAMATSNKIIEIVFFILINILNVIDVIYKHRNGLLFCRRQLLSQWKQTGQLSRVFFS